MNCNVTKPEGKTFEKGLASAAELNIHCTNL